MTILQTLAIILSILTIMVALGAALDKLMYNSEKSKLYTKMQYLVDRTAVALRANYKLQFSTNNHQSSLKNGCARGKLCLLNVLRLGRFARCTESVALQADQSNGETPPPNNVEQAQLATSASE